jgi:hypothetical protein
VSSIKFIHSAKNIQRRLNIKTPTAVLRELWADGSDQYLAVKTRARRSQYSSVFLSIPVSIMDGSVHVLFM